MKSKLVNSIVGGMNFLFGALMLVFRIYMPNANNATIEELKVINEVKNFIFLVMIAVAIVNLITLICNRKDKILLFSYLLAVASSASYYIDISYIGVLYILAALLIEIQVLRENMIYTSSMTYIAVVSIVIVAIGLLGLNVLTYKDRVEKIVKEENKGYLEYQENYFKNISMLPEDAEFLLNVKRNGKWGYINTNGDTKIDFQYDYASPFITISQYDKNFDIALVSKEGTTSIILKNQREVMSFKTEISIDDYEKQFEKLQELYNTIFKQEGKIDKTLYNVPTSDMSSIKSYEGYPYRYKFNDEYDVYITVSQSGGKNRYEFIKQDNPTTKVSIDCDNLKFDSNNLYVYSNGFLPFYKPSENIQGWYTKTTQRVEFEGNIQILEFYDNNILIKDYDNNIVYFADELGNQISPNYKDIFVLEDAYIVKNEEDKYIIIDKQFNQILNNIEYSYINPLLLDKGILLCSNMPAKVNFNSSGFPSNIEYNLVDLSGNVVKLKNLDGTEIENPAYTGIYYLNNKKNVSSYDLYISNLLDIPYEFIGEEYYHN